MYFVQNQLFLFIFKLNLLKINIIKNGYLLNALDKVIISHLLYIPKKFFDKN